MLRISFSENSRKKVVEKYSYEAIGEKMKNYYKKILNA